EKVIRGMELYSSHPIAKSLQEELKGAGLRSFRSVEEEKGIGMKAEDMEGNHYRLGSARILEGKEAPKHKIYLLKNGKFWAGIDIEDKLRPGAIETIAFFKEKGIETVMLSGDKAANCEALAKEVGIDTVYAEQLPQEKLEKIAQFSKDSATAMIGDGVNDAPALSRAFLGISLAKATEVAMQSSEIVLASDNLLSLVELHKISKETVKTIKQNLFWAFFYNILAIPLAAVGMLKPIIAAAAMAFSDTIVIGNSLRLRFKKIS
ncbi:MAG: HAD-IC family P-type ATPase, partial [Bacteroidota bacterium]